MLTGVKRGKKRGEAAHHKAGPPPRKRFAAQTIGKAGRRGVHARLMLSKLFNFVRGRGDRGQNGGESREYESSMAMRKSPEKIGEEKGRCSHRWEGKTTPRAGGSYQEDPAERNGGHLGEDHSIGRKRKKAQWMQWSTKTGP